MAHMTAYLFIPALEPLEVLLLLLPDKQDDLLYVVFIVHIAIPISEVLSTSSACRTLNAQA